jgi:dipeptidase E
LGKLFLYGGVHNKTKKFDRLFEAAFPGSKRVLFIPVALSENVCSYGERYDWIREVFPKLRFDIWGDIAGRTWDEIKKYDAVYIAGGNTYLLLKLILTTKFDKLLLKYYYHSGIIYGSSAGAIILGEDIRSASFGGDADKNKFRLKKFAGLRLLKKYSVQCHYEPSDDESVSYCAKKHMMRIIALPDGTGLLVEGKNIRVIGESKAVLFNKSSKVAYFPESVI